MLGGLCGTCMVMNRVYTVNYSGWEMGNVSDWMLEEAVLIYVRGCGLQELRVDKTALERQMEELQTKQIELDRIKYRAKLEVRHAGRAIPYVQSVVYSP